MYKKLMVLVLLAASAVIFLPTQGKAASPSEKPASFANSANIQRWKMRRWKRTRRVRVIRQVYYRNGRRYVRIIRIRR